MRRAAIGLLGGGGLAVTLVLAGCQRHAPSPAPAGVSAGGVTLVSSAIELPADDGHFPAGAGAELVEANCTGCHSATMALGQPPLSADQWQAEVKKMREAYRAPVAKGDVAAIVAYLVAMPGQHGAGGRVR